MTAHWRIKRTGEVMSVLVTRNPDLFRALIESHAGMEFLGFDDR